MFSRRDIYNLAGSRHASTMEIYEIRRNNMRSLMAGRKQKDCAELWDTAASFLSQILSDKTQKNMGDDLARRIEAAELLPNGWMDQVHQDGSAAIRPRSSGSSTAETDDHHELLLIGDLAPWGSETDLEDDEVAVTLFKEVEFAGGDGSTHSIETTDRKVRFARSTLRECDVEPEYAGCAQVRGNSMERLIMDGATIGFDRSSTSIVDGEIYAFDHDGMLRVKYLYRLPGGGIRIRSENDEEYPDEVISADEASKVRVLGWVFWWSTIRRRKSGRIGR